MDHLTKDQIAGMSIEDRANRLYLLAQIVNPPDTPEMLAEINALLSIPAKPTISGYRDLSPAEVALINDAKALGQTVGKFLDTVAALPGVDQRWLAVARTDLQKGFMALTRSIARPEGF